MALLSGGGYAEFCAVDERCVLPALPHLSGAENAAIPESFLTAYGLLFFSAHVQPGTWVLLSVYLSICLFVYLSVYLSICLSVYLSITLYVYMHACLFVFLPNYPNTLIS